MAKAESSKEYKDSQKQFNKLQEEYNTLRDKYSGNEGYQNSLQQGLQGAGVVAQGQAAQVQGAARNAGMSKSQAAAMGTSAMNNAYQDAFNNQQSMAANMGNQATSQAGEEASRQLNNSGVEQAETQNVYGRKWGNATNAFKAVGEGVKAATSIV